MWIIVKSPSVIQYFIFNLAAWTILSKFCIVWCKRRKEDFRGFLHWSKRAWDQKDDSRWGPVCLRQAQHSRGKELCPTSLQPVWRMAAQKRQTCMKSTYVCIKILCSWSFMWSATFILQYNLKCKCWKKNVFWNSFFNWVETFCSNFLILCFDWESYNFFLPSFV